MANEIHPRDVEDHQGETVDAGSEEIIITPEQIEDIRACALRIGDDWNLVSDALAGDDKVGLPTTTFFSTEAVSRIKKRYNTAYKTTYTIADTLQRFGEVMLVQGQLGDADDVTSPSNPPPPGHIYCFNSEPNLTLDILKSLNPGRSYESLASNYHLRVQTSSPQTT